MLIPSSVLLLLGVFLALVDALPSSPPDRSRPVPRAIRFPAVKVTGREVNLTALQSNAERLQRGLPLLPPKERANRARDPAAPTSSNLATIPFYIRLDAADGTGPLGWISKWDELESGFFAMTTDLTHRLIVGVPQEAVRPGWTGTRGGLQILDENSFGHYPNLALIQGRDDKDSVIQPGSYHYLYLADSQSTPAGSEPSHVENVWNDYNGTPRTVESGLWNVDSETLTLTATWVNPSNTIPKSATVQFFQQDGALFAGGDADAFAAKYDSVQLLSYVLVPV